MKKNKLIGISLITFAIILLVTRLNNWEFPVWPLIPIGIFLSFVYDSWKSRDYEGMAMSTFIALIIANMNYHFLNISNGILFAVGVLIVIGVGYLQEDKDGFSLRVIIKETIDDIASHKTNKTTNFTAHQDIWTYSENAPTSTKNTNNTINNTGTYKYTKTTKIIDEGENDAE